MIGHVDIASVGRLDVLQTQLGDQIGVLAGRDRCWLVVYDRHDPDAALATVELTGEEAGRVVGLLNDAGAADPPEPRRVVVGSLTEALDELAVS